MNAQSGRTVAAALAVMLSASPAFSQDPGRSTAWAGGNGGTAGTAFCSDTEVMAGIYGEYGQWMDRLGVRCVKVDVAGNWIGTPRNGPARGAASSSSKSRFSIDCANGSAVMGFSGAAGSFIHRIALRCKDLAANARTSGSNAALGARGASGGTAFSALTCDADGRPAEGFEIRSGWYVDAAKLHCKQRIPPAPSALTRPSPGSVVTVARPRFTWRKTALANRYELRITQGSSISELVTDTTWLPTTDLPFRGGERVSWWVRSCNDNGCGVPKSADFTYNPPGANYVTTLTATPNPGRIGSLISFRVGLDRNAETNTTAQWQLSPDVCYAAASAGTPYASGRNTTTIPAGQQFVELTVRIVDTLSCRGSGKVETWVGNYQSFSSPYYRALDFSIQ